mgnify:CR=1
MSKPSLKRVTREGDDLWQVTLPDSTVRFFTESWKAQWLYCYALRLWKEDWHDQQ